MEMENIEIIKEDAYAGYGCVLPTGAQYSGTVRFDLRYDNKDFLVKINKDGVGADNYETDIINEAISNYLYNFFQADNIHKANYGKLLGINEKFDKETETEKLLYKKLIIIEEVQKPIYKPNYLRKESKWQNSRSYIMTQILQYYSFPAEI